jgi:hypothetical protein
MDEDVAYRDCFFYLLRSNTRCLLQVGSCISDLFLPFFFSLFFLRRHHIQIRGIDAACRIEDPPSEDTDVNSHHDDTNDVNDSLTADHRHKGGEGSGGYQSQGTGQSGGEGGGRGDAGGAGGSSSAALATPPRLVFLRLSVHLPETAGSCSDITDFLTDVSKRALWDADMESYAVHKTLLHAAPESDAVVRMTRKKFDDRPSVRSGTRCCCSAAHL